MNAADRLVLHVVETLYEDLPKATINAAKVFILDAVGVGIAGSRHPRMAQVEQAMDLLGAGSKSTSPYTATIWGSGYKVPWESAVLINAYQIFNQEFDSIHDRAVIHAMACLLPACIGYAEAHGGVNGRDLIAAITVGLDVAIYIGIAQRAPMAFFRPAMCGGLGAAAAVSKLAKLDEHQTRDAMGIAYSHLSGTMQAHVEGSPAVGMQVGFNARAAVTACALAAAGFPGPHDFLQGPFGYFALFDFGQANWEAEQHAIGKDFQIAHMSHKPYPTGRATHGGIEGALILRSKHGFNGDDVESVIVRASALVVRLVGRPAVAGMDAGYARLCMAYGVATALCNGNVDLTDFSLASLQDPKRIDLAQRVRVLDNGNPDPNAIGGPQEIEVKLHDGTLHKHSLTELLGHPERPLTYEQQDRKFAHCCAYSEPPMAAAKTEALRTSLRQLEFCEDIAFLACCFVGEDKRVAP